jgi:hypothetical protein
VLLLPAEGRALLHLANGGRPPLHLHGCIRDLEETTAFSGRLTGKRQSFPGGRCRHLQAHRATKGARRTWVDAFMARLSKCTTSSKRSIPLPGPETAVFGHYAPCAPIQERHKKPIYYGKRQGRLNAPRGPGRVVDVRVDAEVPPLLVRPLPGPETAIFWPCSVLRAHTKIPRRVDYCEKR